MATSETYCIRITLNGEPAGRTAWRAVFPIEKHEFLSGQQDAKHGGLAGFEKAGPTGCRKRPAHVNVQPVGPP